MAKNLLNKYVWLVETIYKAGSITFEELNEKWLDNDMSEGVELALRTTSRWDRYLGMTAPMTQVPVPTATKKQ